MLTAIRNYVVRGVISHFWWVSGHDNLYVNMYLMYLKLRTTSNLHY